MPLRSRRPLSFAMVATAALAAGCNGGDSSHEGVMRATLTGDGCRYEGSTTPAQGTFAVEVRNETNKPAEFALMILPQGAKLTDVETWFHQALRTWQRTGKYVMHRITWLSSTKGARQAAGELSAKMYRRARLGLLCAPWNQRPFDVVVAAELDVASDG